MLREFWKSLTAQSQTASETRLRVTNLNRNSTLATCAEVADSGPKRSKGLLGRDGLSAGEGLWIVPCEAVHTVGMQFPIDLVYLDRQNRIKKLRNNVPPWRISACFFAHSVLELPSGAIRSTETQRGDKLEFTPVSSSGDASK
ncbi:MAG: DUF192 domain-containing protein [Terracidiphilus sp.]|jgi:uncharacterized membrane protein (UPF0127 family)